MIKAGKRTKMNLEANKRMKQWCIDNDITRCENCNSDYYPTFAHRQKRRYYQTAAELSNPKEFLLLCLKCHELIEYDKELTEGMFICLRKTT